MSPQVKPNDDGPYKVPGPVTVLDGEGNLQKEIAEGKTAYLCRCGASKEKPFCDGTHTAIGFESQVRTE